MAYFGPGNPDHPDYGGFWTALKLAEAEINERGGYRGIPIRIVPVWTEDPWAGGISDMVKLFYEEQVWALIGSVDSSSTHLLEQISAKIRIPVLNPSNTDKSANLANVPWLFSLLPGDHILAGQLAGELEERLQAEDSSFVVISGMDHDSRLFAREFRNEMSERRMVPDFLFEHDPDVPFPWGRINSETDIFVIIASPTQSASLVRKLKETNPGCTILGSPMMGRNRFLDACEDACGNVSYISPGSTDPDSRFSREFKRSSGRNPDYAESSMYDSLMLLYEALNSSGLNRVRLMREIRELPPWKGITGAINWDPLGQNIRKGSIESLGVSASGGRGEK